MDNVTQKGYWKAVDARPESKGTWLANTEVINELKAIKAQHILLVADSCFSKTLMRGASFNTSNESLEEEFYRKNRKLKVRNVLTSGGLEKVADFGPGGHSIFAYQFLKQLRRIEQPTSGHQIYSSIFQVIKNSAKQEPYFGTIDDMETEEGSFYFVKK